MMVREVELEELSHEELELLVRYCANCAEPIPVEDLVYRVRRGLARIFRFTGPAHGLFILSLGDDGLVVETVAGKGIVRHFPEVYKMIVETAKGIGGTRLYHYVSKGGLEKLLRKHTNSRPVARLYREDLI